MTRGNTLATNSTLVSRRFLAAATMARRMHLPGHRRATGVARVVASRIDPRALSLPFSPDTFFSAAGFVSGWVRVPTGPPRSAPRALPGRTFCPTNARIPVVQAARCSLHPGEGRPRACCQAEKAAPRAPLVRPRGAREIKHEHKRYREKVAPGLFARPLSVLPRGGLAGATLIHDSVSFGASCAAWPGFLAGPLICEAAPRSPPIVT